jgi:5S rRNA maturation endonuclease (ribonuclease M5)
MTDSFKLDFNAIDAQLALNMETHINDWFAGDDIKRSGGWWRIGENGGLAVNETDGHWKDHSEDKKGHGLLSLFAFSKGISDIKEAAAVFDDIDTTVTRSKEPPLPQEHNQLGEPDHVYEYRDTNGRIKGAIMRWNKTDERSKDIRQLSVVDGAWTWKQMQGKSPLYGSEYLLSKRDAPVLIVEGEKCVEALRDTFSDYIVMTWCGGSSAVENADWASIEDRSVIIWPDNDKSGAKAASEIMVHLPSCVVLDIPEGKEKSWDGADAIDEGFNVVEFVGDAAAQTSSNGIWDLIHEVKHSTPYIDLTVEPIENDFRAFLMGVPIAEDGDLIVLAARLKSFKSSVIAALACSTVDDESVDCLGFTIRGDGVFLVFDTEQSENEIRYQAKSMRHRLGVASLSDRIKIVGLREFAPSDRLAMIKHAIMENMARGIVGIAVDGVSDLGGSVNDDEKAAYIVNFLTVAASRANAPLFGVIHLNHGDREAVSGGRGHLGKEMERKAKTVICIEKDADDIGTIYAATSRRKPISKSQGQRIKYCEDKNMVISLEGTKKDEKDAEKLEELRELLYEVQDRTGVLIWNKETIVSAIIEVNGKSKKTAERRVRDMINACLLRHSGQKGNVVSLLGARTNTKMVLLTAV